MLEGLLGSDSFIRVLFEELLYEIFRWFWHILPLFVCELVFTLHILVKNLFWRVTFEKRAASQDDVEDHSYTKHVRLTVVALLS